MMPAVLADTGPLYAAVDIDDYYHRQAQSELGRLAHEKTQVIIIYSTPCEAYSLVLRRLGMRVARIWLQDVTSGATLIEPTPHDYGSAFVLVQKYADQLLTLFDAVLTSVSQRLAWPVWTYNHHFDVVRAQVWR